MITGPFNVPRQHGSIMSTEQSDRQPRLRPTVNLACDQVGKSRDLAHLCELKKSAVQPKENQGTFPINVLRDLCLVSTEPHRARGLRKLQKAGDNLYEPEGEWLGVVQAMR